MNDLIDRLRMTPKELKAAKMTGAVLLAPVLVMLAWLLLPLLAAAAFTPAGPLIVAGAILGGGLLAGLAAMNRTARGLAGLAYTSYLALFTKAYRTFLIEDEDVSEDDWEHEEAEQEDPVEKTRDVIDRLEKQHQRMLLAQVGIDRFIADCQREEDSSSREAEAFKAEALDLDDSGDRRRAEVLIQKAGLKEQTAAKFGQLTAGIKQFRDSLQTMSNQLELDIMRIKEELSLQEAQLRSADLRQDALGSHLGELGERSEQELSVRQAVAELRAAAEMRAADIEIRLAEGHDVLARVNIANVAGSQQVLRQWSGATRELAAMELPSEHPSSATSRLGRRARALSVAEPESAPTTSGESDEDRRARIRRELAARRTNKS
ncbi:MAG: hypothetical protein HQ488_04690 [Parcubacteria group bacterium]|nr:hypothetical protein [Parcubacteria group bacterium]